MEDILDGILDSLRANQGCEPADWAALSDVLDERGDLPSFWAREMLALTQKARDTSYPYRGEILAALAQYYNNTNTVLPSNGIWINNPEGDGKPADGWRLMYLRFRRPSSPQDTILREIARLHL